jgi:hypothetical protein
MYRQRFGLTGHPLPKDAQGKTFFEKSPGFQMDALLGRCRSNSRVFRTR